MIIEMLTSGFDMIMEMLQSGGVITYIILLLGIYGLLIWKCCKAEESLLI